MKSKTNPSECLHFNALIKAGKNFVLSLSRIRKIVSIIIKSLSPHTRALKTHCKSLWSWTWLTLITGTQTPTHTNDFSSKVEMYFPTWLVFKDSISNLVSCFCVKCHRMLTRRKNSNSGCAVKQINQLIQYFPRLVYI